jgi:hypothetical protein
MMPLKAWFFSHVFLTLALGARNSVVAGAAPTDLVHNGSFEENSDSGLHTQRVDRCRSSRHRAAAYAQRGTRCEALKGKGILGYQYFLLTNRGCIRLTEQRANHSKIAHLHELKNAEITW